ncbi:MAG: acyl-CoA thioesterase [Cyclobacteriaceae bacterium]
MNEQPKPVKHSQTTITELMIPSYANFGGKIHGGILLSLMDKVAFACATKHSRNYCVTVSVVGVEFLQPVEVGDLVSLLASVNYVGRTSMVVGIRVIAENVKLGLVKHTNTSYFTMVAKDENDNPTTVPPLLLEEKEEVKRFIEAMQMREIEGSIKEKLNDVKSRTEVSKATEILKDQRCVIAYK